MTIDDIIEGVVAREGGYVNDPHDTGGETNFGITIATARAAGYAGPMRSLPRDLAKAIYRRRYVEAPGFDRVAAIDATVAAELVDTGVNMGPTVATRFLQRSLNVLNRGGRDFADVAADGAIGPASLAAFKSFITRRGREGAARLIRLLNALQGERYVSLCEGRVQNETFMYGWLERLA